MSKIKNEWRVPIIQKRNTLDIAFQKTASAAIIQKLIMLSAIKSAKTIALYYGTRGEANPFFITNSLQDKTWLLPVIQDNNQMQFEIFQAHTPLTKNKYGILEPATKKTSNNTIHPQHIDVILLPMVAFDLAGHRIGQGGGYYDRVLYFMKNSRIYKPCLIGIAYEFQKIPKIIPDPWDVNLDMVVTEKKVYPFTKKT